MPMLLLIAAVILLFLAAFRMSPPRVDLGWLGLALFVTAVLWPIAGAAIHT
jgi:hypothetical protein